MFQDLARVPFNHLRPKGEFGEIDGKAIVQQAELNKISRIFFVHLWTRSPTPKTRVSILRRVSISMECPDVTFKKFNCLKVELQPDKHAISNRNND